MGDLVEFPVARQPLFYPWTSVSTENCTVTARCDDPMHYFADVHERCECGKHVWPHHWESA